MIFKYHRIKVHFGEDVTAFEDVMVDEEAKLLIGTVAKVTSDRVTPSISYHDFSVVLFRCLDNEREMIFIFH